jgi:hypothetical protein
MTNGESHWSLLEKKKKEEEKKKKESGNEWKGCTPTTEVARSG